MIRVKAIYDLTHKCSGCYYGLLVALLFVVFPRPLYAAVEAEHFHTNPFYSIVAQGQYIYGCTELGVKRVDRSTGAVEPFAPQGLEGYIFDGIVSAPDGTIWLWADDSLYSHDGSGWSEHRDLGGRIIDVDTDSQSRLWLLTFGGPHSGEETPYNFSVYDGALGKIIFSWVSGYPAHYDVIYYEPANTIWTSNSEGWVFQLNITEGDTTWVCNRSGVFSGYGKKTIAVDNAGALWLNTHDNRLASLRDNVVTIHEDGPQGSSLLFFDSRDRLWANTPSGLRSYVNGELNTYDIHNVLSATEDEDGSVWFGTSLGLVKFDGNSVVDVLPSELPVNWINGISDLFVDHTGTVWCASDSGIFAFNGRAWVQAVPPIPESGFTPHPVSLAVDKNGHVWVGTGYGVYRYDGASWQFYGEEIFESPCDFAEILVGEDGAIWFIGEGYLFRFKNEAWERIDASSHDFVSIATDHAGGLWAGGRQLHHISPDGTSEQVSVPGFVHGVAISDLGVLWVCWGNGLQLSLSTYSGGVWEFRQYLSESLFLRSMTFDREGVLWLGMYDCVSYDGNTLEVFSEENGLLVGDYINEIAVDDNNDKWLATNLGVTKILAGEQSPDTVSYTDISKFRIAGIAPNPFNSSTEITVTLPELVIAEIDIFNILGQKIKTLLDTDHLEKGVYTYKWDGHDDFGIPVSSGIYICRFTYRTYGQSDIPFSDREKMTLIR